MKFENCELSENLWFDYFVGEIQGSYKKDLDAHLLGCLRCQKMFGEIKATEFITKKTDTSFREDAFFDNLHDKIMAQVREKSAPAKVLPWAEKWSSVIGILNLRPMTMAATAAGLGLVIVGTLFVSRQFGRDLNSNDLALRSAAEERLMVEQAHMDLEILGDAILSTETSDDLVMEAAAEKLAGLSDRQVKEALNRLR